MDDEYSGHRVINKTVRTACIPASYPSSPQNPIMDWDWRFGLKDLACGSEFSFARPSAATSIFPGANVKTVASNAPRFESNGLPLEGSATNLALWSNSFTAEHGHTLTDCTTVVSPTEYILTDGNDAPRYATILTASANSGRVARNNISVTSGTKVNWSIFVKGISGKFRFAGYDGAQLVSALFDPTTNSFSSISDPGGISSQLQYQPLPNNWLRLSITITPSVTSSTAAASIGLELSGNSGYISGSQFTVGPMLSSYIYTESASVTRASEGSDTSNNGLTLPLTQAMVDSLSPGGSGTLIQTVYLTWPSSMVPSNTVIPICTPNDSGLRCLHIHRSSVGTFYPGRLSDGVNIVTSKASERMPGSYTAIVQWSAITLQMRIGIYDPASGTLTWGNYATYRGFFPITATGGQSMRWFYGGGNLNISLTSTQWFNCVLTDDDLLFYIKKFGCAL